MRELLLSRTDAIRVHEAHPRNRLSLPEVPATANESNHKRERLMDDLEATRLCAEAMELPQPIENRNGAIWCGGHTTRGFSGKEPYRVGGLHYKPLHDDAQAMALVKRFRLNVQVYDGW